MAMSSSSKTAQNVVSIRKYLLLELGMGVKRPERNITESGERRDDILKVFLEWSEVWS